jgi:hypothetical protein
LCHTKLTSTLCAIETDMTSPLSNSIVAPQPAVSLDRKSLDMCGPKTRVVLSSKSTSISNTGKSDTSIERNAEPLLRDRNLS